MTLRSLRSTAFLALLAVPAVLPAQTSASEEERMEALARAGTDWYVPKDTVTMGFRVLSNGVNVHFQKLGSVPFPATPIPPASAGAVLRNYDNGIVQVDGLRADEMDAFGNQTSTPGGRYQTLVSSTENVLDANGNIIGTTTTTKVSGDFLSYTPGMTRQWTYATPEQAVMLNGSPYIAMSSYSASSDGASMEKKQGPSGGIEVQFAHAMGKFTKRTEWSLVAGLALNGINNKTAGDVASTLHTYTDFYSLNGQTAPETSPTAPYVAPAYADLTDAEGNPVVSGGKEITVPISAVPGETKQTAEPGATTVHGRWQIKGAYFMMRVGPALRAQLTEKLGVSASLGLAGAFAGTHYTAEETLDVPNVGTSLTVSDSSDANRFLGGYYADFNLEWSANETTGLFAGLSAQSFGDYSQELNERSARVDLGSSLGIRGGISVRF